MLLRSMVMAVPLVLAMSCVAGAQPLPTSVVQIRAIASDGSINIGSGVISHTEKVATACHVTRGAVSIEVHYGGERWSARDQVGSQLHDLCVLSVPSLHGRVATTRPSADLKPGEGVIAVGFETGGPAVAKRGTVAMLYSYDGGNVIRTDAPFDFGSSGGGLFDEAGNLVGILSFKAQNEPSLRFALPSEWLTTGASVSAAFLPIAPGSQTPAFWERSQAERPTFLGVALREVASKRR